MQRSVLRKITFLVLESCTLIILERHMKRIRHCGHSNNASIEYILQEELFFPNDNARKLANHTNDEIHSACILFCTASM